MNIPMSWLKEYVELDCDVNTFADEMTMSGSKVEKIERLGAEISNVVVGKVISIENHPNADKLLITKVDVGQGENLQIITGAKNLNLNDLVPVALDGATLAKGIKIKTGKLRGELSEGMFCSVEELGYNLHDYPEAPKDGIYIFQDEQQLGADIKPILQICEDVVEFEITSNRPDCYSVIGIARETAATFNKKLKLPEIKLLENGLGNILDLISVDIQNKDITKRYVARVVKNIKLKSSPLWLRHMLTTAGIKPINNIVDITNYVMWEFGQPLHGYDISCISNNKIVVHNAKKGETLLCLDGIERTLDETVNIISDESKVLGIAGIIGGESCKITDETVDVLFESANFDGTNIRLSSKKIGLRTEASTKFEKGIDPNLCKIAIDRAMELIELLECGEVVSDYIDIYPEPTTNHEVKFRVEKINSILGTNINKSNICEYLNRLEIETNQNEDYIIATIPTFRQDIKTEADLSEEVGRLYGYNKIESSLGLIITKAGKKSQNQIIEDNIKDIMVSMGLYEILNYSFESPKVFEKLNIDKESKHRNVVNIINPLGEDFSIMRTTTLNYMLQSLSINYNRKNKEVKLFELAKIYEPKNLPLTKLPNEDLILTIGMYGNKDYFYIKGMIETLFSLLNVNNVEFEVNSALPFMHSGRTTSILINAVEIGYVGELHPKVSNNYDIEDRVYIATVNITKLMPNVITERKFVSLPKYPATSRDLALVVKDELYSSDIQKAIFEKSGSLLTNVELFDSYKGSQIQEGYKSLAYKLVFRSNEKTLTDEEVNISINKITQHLKNKFEITFR